MGILKLTPRLAAIAALVPEGARIADIGTDHGYIPIYLAQNGIADSVIAADIVFGPLEAARRNAVLHEVDDKIQFILCDGLCGIDPDSVDTVIIAGMGGDNIAGILSRAPWSAEDGRLLILQPASRPWALRRYLAENGFKVMTEQLTEDSGRIYPIMTARRGAERAMTPAEEYTGKIELISGDPLLGALLGKYISELSNAISGMSSSEREELIGRREKLTAVLNGLTAMKGELPCGNCK